MTFSIKVQTRGIMEEGEEIRPGFGAFHCWFGPYHMRNHGLLSTINLSFPISSNQCLFPVLFSQFLVQDMWGFRFLYKDQNAQFNYKPSCPNWRGVHFRTSSSKMTKGWICVLRASMLVTCSYKQPFLLINPSCPWKPYDPAFQCFPSWTSIPHIFLF